jgi:hypothetical protein
MDFVETLRETLVDGDLERARTLIGGVWHEREGLRRRVKELEADEREAYGVVAELSAPIGRIRCDHPGADPDLVRDCVKRLRALLNLDEHPGGNHD